MTIPSLIACVLVAAASSVGAQTSAIRWFTIDAGFGTTVGGALQMTSVPAQPVAGMSQSPATRVASGFLTDVTLRYMNKSNSLLAGWNMVSVPLRLGDYAKTSVFPTAVSDAFTYQGGYVSQPLLQNGKGYWVRFATGTVVSMAGVVRTADTIQVAAGWNMIGGLSDAVPIASIQQVPPGNVISVYFGYHGGYQPALTLEPATGYWVRVSTAGKLVVRTSGPFPKVEPGMTSLTGLSRLTIIDSAGHTQGLFVGAISPGDSMLYELPPSPPAGIADIRFGSGRLVEDFSRTGREVPVILSSVPFPVTLRWQQQDSARVSLVIDGSVRVLDNEARVSIAHPPAYLALRASTPVSALPAEFRLLQNFPNPFNPSTRISFALPEPSLTRLLVFNILGQVVCRLIDDEREAGVHFAEWQGTNQTGDRVGTGIYFYRIEARPLSGGSPFTDVRRMLLLR